MFSRGPRLLLSLALLAAAGPAAAQEWQEMTSFRQRSDEGSLAVEVRYGAGTLDIRPGAAGELYRLGIRYDADLFDPIAEYRSGTLRVGVEGSGRGIRIRNHDSGGMTLALSREIPLDLDIDFGAVAAEMELGGLRIRGLDIETGASETRLRFGAPNPERCERLALSMGAAAFEAEGLGHAGCRSVVVEGGVGDITLDFSGAWGSDIDADVSMALGSLTLVVPEDVGVRVEKQTFLTGFEGRRMQERDGVHYSENWNAARYRLSVDLTGAFGSVDLRWTSAAGLTTP